jgi:hypothetical protein
VLNIVSLGDSNASSKVVFIGRSSTVIGAHYPVALNKWVLSPVDAGTRPSDSTENKDI